jgi:uncharacterized membrane protein
MSTELPRSLRWAVRLLAAEAVVVGVLALGLGYQAVAARPDNLAGAIAVAGYVALAATALGGLAAALYRRKARARAPAIVLQLLLVMLAVVLATSGWVWVAVPAALLGMAVATLLFAPSTHVALSS